MSYRNTWIMAPKIAPEAGIEIVFAGNTIKRIASLDYVLLLGSRVYLEGRRASLD